MKDLAPQGSMGTLPLQGILLMGVHLLLQAVSMLEGPCQGGPMGCTEPQGRGDHGDRMDQALEVPSGARTEGGRHRKGPMGAMEVSRMEGHMDSRLMQVSDLFGAMIKCFVPASKLDKQPSDVVNQSFSNSPVYTPPGPVSLSLSALPRLSFYG